MPFSARALAARIKRWRAMMIPLSVETRFSLVWSQTGPMLSCSEASWIAKPATPLHVGEVVFVALGALEQRIGAEVAAVQKGDMARIDPALHRLQPIAFLQALGDEGLIGRHRREFPFRQRRLLLRRTHIGPQHRPALHQRVGLELDLLAETALARLGGDVRALAGDVVFPAVIGAAQATLLVAAGPRPHP